jgi:2'-5' RNA ligase
MAHAQPNTAYSVDVALSLPEKTKKAVYRFAKKCANPHIVLSKPSSYHISLVIVSPVTSTEVDKIKRAVSKVAFHAFPATFNKCTLFGQQHQFVVLTAKGGSQRKRHEFNRLHHRIQQAMEKALGRKIQESNSYRAHCTIARTAQKPSERFAALTRIRFPRLSSIRWTVRKSHVTVLQFPVTPLSSP